MIFEFSPALSDEDAELLEIELGSIADELGIEGIDIARLGEEGDDHLTMLDLFYEDQDDDEQLAKFSEEILGEFERCQSEGRSFTKDFIPVRARVGRITIKVVKEGEN